MLLLNLIDISKIVFAATFWRWLTYDSQDRKNIKSLCSRFQHLIVSFMCLWERASTILQFTGAGRVNMSIHYHYSFPKCKYSLITHVLTEPPLTTFCRDCLTVILEGLLHKEHASCSLLMTLENTALTPSHHCGSNTFTSLELEESSCILMCPSKSWSLRSHKLINYQQL